MVDSGWIVCHACPKTRRTHSERCPHCGAGKAPPKDERKCPTCAEWVKSEAKKCRHCGEPLEPLEKPQPAVESQAEAHTPPTKSRAGFLKVGVLVIVSIVGWWWIVASWPDSPRSTTTTSSTDELMACYYSKQAVEGRLKSPASAKWVSCYSATSNGVQAVRAVVDSQNGFGAMIRSTWLATVRNGKVEEVVQLQ